MTKPQQRPKRKPVRAEPGRPASRPTRREKDEDAVEPDVAAHIEAIVRENREAFRRLSKL